MINVKIDTRDFERSLKKFDAKFNKALVASMESNVLTLEKEAVLLSPFRTGELESSTKTEVRNNSEGIVGSVTFEVPYAAIRHNDLGSNPGPGTRGKSPTAYGVPGPNYLQNPGRGLGKDLTYHKNRKKEVKKI